MYLVLPVLRDGVVGLWTRNSQISYTSGIGIMHLNEADAMKREPTSAVTDFSESGDRLEWGDRPDPRTRYAAFKLWARDATPLAMAEVRIEK